MVNRRDSAWIALAAACALVVHLFVSGFVGATLAADGGTAICSATASAGFPGSDHPAGRHTAPDCCLAGCPMVAGKADVPVAVYLAPLAVPNQPLPAAPRHRIAPLHEWSPVSPRGPPPAA